LPLFHNQPDLPPVQLNEEERLAALRSYNILDTAEEKDFDELTELASAICQSPIALISLVDAERQWFKSHTGLSATETPVEQSFCAHAIVSYNDIMVVDDARTDERFADNPLVTADPKIVFYAGVPLINEDGFALGTLCVIDRDKKQLTDAQTNALKILAKQVVDKLELRRKILDLQTTNQELREANMFIQKFASTAAHDIKNPLSSIHLTSQALKIRLQKLEDEGCLRLIDLNLTSTNRLIGLLDEMLDYSKDPSLLLSKKIDIDLRRSLKKLLLMINVPENIEIILPPEGKQITISEVSFEQIFINLLSNAIRYNDKVNGLIEIRFAEDNDYYRFEVEDNGIGISPEYHDKIFSNSFTLKITDRYNKKGTGIGLATVKDLINALKGTIYVKSSPGLGTTFFIAIKK
jgi:signal transduction histidine kinase